MANQQEYLDQVKRDWDVVEAACRLVIEKEKSAELLAAAGYKAKVIGLLADARITLKDLPGWREFDCTKAYPWWLYRSGSLAGAYIRNVLAVAAKLSTDQKFAELIGRRVS